MKFPTFRYVALALLVLSMCNAALATAQDKGAIITASGVAKLEQPPTTLRLTITLAATGKTLKDALKAMEDRRTAATAQLKKLAADEATIRFTAASLGSGDQREDLQRMMRQLHSSGRAPRGLQVPQSVTATCTLTAQWPLEFDSPEKLLLISKEIQDKVEAADLAGLKAPKNLTPAEQELEEELALSAESYPGESNAAQPGQPAFSYVRRFTDEERSAGRAEAFAKAKAEAAQLAAAAGRELGELVELKGNVGSGIDEDYGYAYQAMMRQRLGASGDENEAVSPQPGPVTQQFMVEAKFRTK